MLIAQVRRGKAKRSVRGVAWCGVVWRGVVSELSEQMKSACVCLVTRTFACDI
jgi:hypothetical protein